MLPDFNYVYTLLPGSLAAEIRKYGASLIFYKKTVIGNMSLFVDIQICCGLSWKFGNCSCYILICNLSVLFLSMKM
jgi:hypothetical protein